jgi:hypothetical protein
MILEVKFERERDLFIVKNSSQFVYKYIKHTFCLVMQHATYLRRICSLEGVINESEPHARHTKLATAAIKSFLCENELITGEYLSA